MGQRPCNSQPARLSTKALADAQSRGLQVWAHIINELDEALSLLEMGVERIIFDRLAMAWKALALHGEDWEE
jgi:glycerophosphoryl diester phosphodiesterase